MGRKAEERGPFPDGRVFSLVDKSLPEVRLSLFLAMIIVIGFLNYPIKKGHVRVNHIPWYDVALMVAGAGPFLYFAANAQKILLTSYSVISKDPFMLALAIVAILVLVELCRRSSDPFCGRRAAHLHLCKCPFWQGRL